LRDHPDAVGRRSNLIDQTNVTGEIAASLRSSQ